MEVLAEISLWGLFCFIGNFSKCQKWCIMTKK